RQLFDGVHVLAAAVVPAPRIALRVLVGHHRADGFEDRLGDEVLGSDELEVPRLPLRLEPDGLGNLRIGLLEPSHDIRLLWRGSDRPQPYWACPEVSRRVTIGPL